MDKLRRAQFFMMLGLLPFGLAVIFVALMIWSARIFGGGSLTIALLGIFLLGASYLVGLLTSGFGTIWSFVLMCRQPQLRTYRSIALSVIVVLLLVLPPFLYLYAAL